MPADDAMASAGLDFYSTVSQHYLSRFFGKCM